MSALTAYFEVVFYIYLKIEHLHYHTEQLLLHYDFLTISLMLVGNIITSLKIDTAE